MIYLDNAATTRVLPQAAEIARNFMETVYANPASLHQPGLTAELALEEARTSVAKAAGVLPEEIYFCPGGTYANNAALLGIGNLKRKGRIISSAFEHPAVEECLKVLEKTFEIIRLRPVNGQILPEQVESALTPDTVLVSLMQVNNETGAVTDLRKIRQILHRTASSALLHTDAVQGFLKEEPIYSVVDMASFSGHKTHAPKGIGALYLKKGLHLPPFVRGGGQEKGLFSGTSNTPAAAAWGKACRILTPKWREHRSQAEKVCRTFWTGLEALGAKVLSPRLSNPYVLSFAFPGYLGENILHTLSAREIYLSTGSACSSRKASTVMKAIGQEAMSRFALRASFSFETTQEEALQTLDSLKDILGSLRKV